MTTPPKTISEESEKTQIMRKYHNDPMYGGHCGKNRMYSKIRAHYYWKNMAKDIARHTKTCHECQTNKIKTHTKEPMTITQTPAKPFDLVILDTIGPLPKTINGNIYAITLICDMTKFLITIPAQDKEAKTIARKIFNNFILIHGPMKEIRTDKGSEYKNEIMTELCRQMKINHQISTAYHHETVGSIERNHRTLNEYLRSYCNSKKDDWDEYIKYFTYCYNSTPHGSFNHKFSPFELIFAKKPNIPEYAVKNKIDPIYNIDNYSKETKYRLQKAYKEVQEYLNKYKQINKNTYDQKQNPINININEQILLETGNRHKLDPIFSGPYIVKNKNEPNVTIEHKNTKKQQVVHKNRIKKYHN